MRADHPLLELSRNAAAHQPLRLAKGLVGAYLAYPIAERAERREVMTKLRELRALYRSRAEERNAKAAQSLAATVAFAAEAVPYYRDLFTSIRFDPARLEVDPRYLDDIPVLTKDIIVEQGERLLSRPLAAVRHYACKTGGSTGRSAVIFYDQVAADYAAAVTLFCRESIGKRRFLPETHLAARFADQEVEPWPSREDFKCFAMNRSNIFFDRTDDAGLEEMWQQLRRRPPFLLHGHPSTIHALALYVERRYGPMKCFAVFESSGELLEGYMREVIERALCCQVIDRYGLAELGVVAYQNHGEKLRVLESEVWAEDRPGTDGESELVFTGFRNRLMPLIRYATGDLGRVRRDEEGGYIESMVGRIHDRVLLGGTAYLTHHIQDVLDHRVRGIQEFQIDLRGPRPVLKLVLEPAADAEETRRKVEHHWPDSFDVEFVGAGDLVRVGHRAKFRHVVTA